VRVVADSHTIVWYTGGSSRLSSAAADALVEAEETDGIVVSVATFIDLWYVTQTTEAVTTDDLARLRSTLEASSAVTLQPVTLEVVDACTAIQRELLADPWDRLIVATAKALGVALVTRDRAIQKAELVPTVW
jgi:PIN domain nuclease of toxin-antitoxin system